MSEEEIVARLRRIKYLEESQKLLEELYKQLKEIYDGKQKWVV